MHHLTMHPFLQHPYPELPFMVEVNACDVGIGAVLSQQSSSESNLHPCAFSVHHLTAVERNDNIVAQDLLAVKLLEGTEHLFLVWTDDKNLIYIEQAKCHNPCQESWALFVSWFNFVLSY